MALAVDSEMATNLGDHLGGLSNNALSPRTYSFTNTAGTLLLLFVIIGDPGASTAAVVSSASYGGTGMTLVKNQWTGGGTTGSLCAVYRLLSPATGSNTVSIAYNLSGSGGQSDVVSGLISFTGNDTSAPIAQNTSTTGSSTSPSVNLAGCVSGNITAAVCCAGTHFSTATLTKSWQSVTDDGSSGGNGYCSRTASSGTVTHGFTLAGSDSWATVMVEVAAAGGAAALSPVHASLPFRGPGRNL